MSEDQLIPQLQLGPRIGGLKELATRLAFYNGIGNSLMVAALYYAGDPMIPGVGQRLHTVFPTILHFYGLLLVLAVIVAFVEHTFVIRAQASYNQLQEFNHDTSPIRRDVAEMQDQLDDIQAAIEEENE